MIATPAKQRSLPGLKLSTNTALLEIGTVRAVRGVDAETILAEVDAGEFRWVWNVTASEDRAVRELRFWRREVETPEVQAWALDAVIDDLLGTRAEWRGPEIAQLLIVSRPTVHRLAEELRALVVGGVIKTQRAALVNFLKRRLV